MRTKYLLEALSGFTIDQAKKEYFLNLIPAGNPNAGDAAPFDDARFKGGWEGWLQCEMGLYFKNHDDYDNYQMVREEPYPNVATGVAQNAYLSYNSQTQTAGVTNNGNQAARADFQLKRLVGSEDITYVEVKCITAGEFVNDINAAWTRFDNDIVKITKLHARNEGLSFSSLLLSYGTFDANGVDAIGPGLVQSDRSAYVLDFGNREVTEFKDVATGGVNRLFLIGVGL